MCGIAGFVGVPNNRPLLEKMVSQLVHRGPDDVGYWMGEGASLGMRRLSILDLKEGQQPVFNEDKTVISVFNGEIYNHIELRRNLLGKGHRFRSHHSDSEVIVHLYEEYGTDMFQHLNGMFAIVIWDVRKKILLAARDHAGIKPLYFSRIQGALIFGSEPKALMAHPSISTDPDLTAIHHYFTFKHIPAPCSAYRDIQQLRAGEYLVWKDKQVTQKKWWSLPLDDNRKVTEQEAAENIYSLVEDSVKLQMQSDVPIGAYLSGGLDSSSVVAIMANNSSRPVDTFTLTYAEGNSGKTEDQEFARRVSRICGTNHHERLIKSSELPASIEAITKSFDEPFSGVISTWFLTGLISEYVTVALSGDGADELFGSYRSHRLAEPLALWQSVEKAGQEEKEAAAGIIANAGIDLYELESILRRGDEAGRRMEQFLFDEEAKRKLYSPKMLASVGHMSTESIVRNEYKGIKAKDALNRALSLDYLTLLPDQVLAFVDRLSMAHSVEVRPPFLDPRVVEYVSRLPSHLKIKNGRLKHILKEAMQSLLPANLIDRKKEGFLMPINQWLATSMSGFIADTLSTQRIQKHGLFNPVSVAELQRGTFCSGVRSEDRIWSLLVFQLWWERTYSDS